MNYFLNISEIRIGIQLHPAVQLELKEW